MKTKKWVGISGSWRTSTAELEQDVEREISKVLAGGEGIVTGGALGVDYAVTVLALKHQPDGRSLKVILPTTLKIYAAHYRKRAEEGVITQQQAEELIALLERVKQLGVLIENPNYTEVNETYYLRDTEVVNASDRLIAFQVNNSAGAQDTIDKARKKGIPVEVFSYTVA